MRLISITVRNYRLHQELTVRLDPQRTVIGGPNESGKSTLVEAAHRALFLRAKTGGDKQKSMQSRLHTGHPEVEVRFESGGRVYHLHKRFSGASGTIKLTDFQGEMLTGDEAETRLVELLGVDAATAKKKALLQWGHLWVWQGDSGKDPTEHANSQRDSLLNRLQGEGGGAAMQSELDSRVARTFSEKCETLFNRNGEPKAGSELGRAQAEEASTLAELLTAREALARLEQVVADYGDAEEIIRTSEAALVQLRPQLAEVEAQLVEIAARRNDEQTQMVQATAAVEKHEALAANEDRIVRLRKGIQKIGGVLAPKEIETDWLQDDASAWRERDAAAETATRLAGESVRSVRQKKDLASACVQQFEKAVRRNQIEAKRGQVREARKTLAALEEKWAQGPAITLSSLKSLQQLETQASRHQLALESMAAGVELMASDLAVQVGDSLLAVGEVHTLTEDAEIAIGTSIRLRIRPGGGTNLADARRQRDETRARLQRELDAHGLKSVAEAIEAETRRREWEAEIKTARAVLESLGAATIEADFAEAEKACAFAEAERARRQALVPDLPAPIDFAAANALDRQFAEQLAEAEAEEIRAKAAREATSKSLRLAGEKLELHVKSLEEQRRTLNGQEAQLRLLIETHGNDAKRALQMGESLAQRTKAEALLTETRRALLALQPDLLERDHARFKRALEMHGAAKYEAEKKRAIALNELQRDGTVDPQADLAVAEANAAAATEHRQQAERKAGAVKLLHDLFLEEQKALADQFTEPLIARISGYLECLFGPGARAVVTLENNDFVGLQLVRPSDGAGPLPFDTLSGGAREQVAAAVRLAMAEVLAQAHGGCLPVVFDDAFAYSDPERVRTLQRMLDRAAGQGLQVIVLTCTPSDYTALGAASVSLKAAAPVDIAAGTVVVPGDEVKVISR